MHKDNLSVGKDAVLKVHFHKGQSSFYFGYFALLLCVFFDYFEKFYENATFSSFANLLCKVVQSSQLL